MRALTGVIDGYRARNSGFTIQRVSINTSTTINLVKHVGFEPTLFRSEVPMTQPFSRMLHLNYLEKCTSFLRAVATRGFLFTVGPTTRDAFIKIAYPRMGVEPIYPTLLAGSPTVRRTKQEIFKLGRDQINQVVLLDYSASVISTSKTI